MFLSVVIVLLLVVLLWGGCHKEGFTHLIVTPTSRPMPVVPIAPITGEHPLYTVYNRYLTTRIEVRAAKMALGKVEDDGRALRAASQNNYTADIQDRLAAYNETWQAVQKSLILCINQYNLAARDLRHAQRQTGITLVTFSQ